MTTKHLLKTHDFETGQAKAWCAILMTALERQAIVREIEHADCENCRHLYLLEKGRREAEAHSYGIDNVHDHPTRHMVDIPIPVQVGETIQVAGYDFVVTDLMVTLNEPPTLIVKSPQELAEERKDSEPEFRFFKEALEGFKNYEPEDSEEMDLPPLPPSLKAFVDGIKQGVQEIVSKNIFEKPVGPLKVVDQTFDESEDGDG